MSKEEGQMEGEREREYVSRAGLSIEPDSELDPWMLGS